MTARRGFGGSTYNPPPTEPPPPPKSKTTVFPLAVREYVQRCFDSENNIPSVTQQEMQDRLKVVINQAATAGGLDSTDWASVPLPQTMVLEDRKRAVHAPKPFPHDNFGGAMQTNFIPASTNKSTAKKRKSPEMIDSDMATAGAAAPPWRKVNPSNVFESRAAPPSPKPTHQTAREKRQKKQNEKTQQKALAFDSSRSVTDLEKRRQRFGLEPDGDDSPVHGMSRSVSPPAAMQGPVIGTCQDLEKRYFRLTSAPKPETVRPQPILEKALDFLKKKWKTDYNYSYICDQFKSMRQDLTVQHIKNSFTVNVYETHAHIALQKQDLGEYNQCQTQLRALYKQRLGGRPAEFLAYRILYFIYTGNRTDMNDLLARVIPADRQVAAVKHALDVRSALALGNYHRFFRLYLEAPNMGPYLMDIFVARERLAYLATMSRA